MTMTAPEVDAVSDDEIIDDSAGDKPSSKELRALARQFKQGYKFVRTSGGHFRIRDRHGQFVKFRGHNLTVSQRPSPGVLRAFREELVEAQVLQGTKPRAITDEAVERRKAANRDRMERMARDRQVEATARLERYRAVFDRMHGLVPGLSGDLGHVAAMLIQEQPDVLKGRRLQTPDLLVQNAHRMLNGAWVEADYAIVWDTLIERLEHAPDPIGEWYSLVREARHLPLDTVEVRLPEGSADDWPFRVELLPIDALLVDRDAYQRPVSWPFVRKEAARFDPSLVGTIDVAQRSPSQFAIVDGQQRSEIVRLVGKRTLWCSIYVGLDVESEARMFLRKNRDRKTMHPYYTFRASLTANDPDAVGAHQIVERHGYRLAIAAPNETREANIAAIAAVQTAYARKLPDGTPTLEPTLAVLNRATLGLDHGQDSMLIRGLSRLFVERPDVDVDVLVAVLTERTPTLVLARARELKRTERATGEGAVARVLTREHDTRVRRVRRG